MTVAMVNEFYDDIVNTGAFFFDEVMPRYRYALPYTREDFIQTALESVLAAPSPDLAPGIKLRTCVMNIVKWRIRDEVRRVTGRRSSSTNSYARGNINMPAVLLSEITDEAKHDALTDASAHTDACARTLSDEECQAFIARLPLDDRQRDIVLMRYAGMSLESIGATYGITDSRVGQIMAEVRAVVGEIVRREVSTA